jgi:hypothetical protein
MDGEKIWKCFVILFQAICVKPYWTSECVSFYIVGLTGEATRCQTRPTQEYSESWKRMLEETEIFEAHTFVK